MTNFMKTLPRQRTPQMLDLTPRAIRRIDTEPPVTIWNVTKMILGALLLGTLALAVILLAGGWAS